MELTSFRGYEVLFGVGVGGSVQEELPFAHNDNRIRWAVPRMFPPCAESALGAASEDFLEAKWISG